MISSFRHSPALSKFKIFYSSSLATQSLSSSPISSKFTNFSVLLLGCIPTHHLLQIHAQIYRVGAHQDNLIATRLIGHYPPYFALRVFYQLQLPNIFPFNAVIRVLAEEGLFSDAFFLFKTLKRVSLSPNDLTFSFLLKACFQSSNSQHVQQIHTHIMKIGFVLDSFVCNGLVLVYAKGLRDLVSAHKVFHEMPEKSVVSCWTSLVSGCAQLGQTDEVLQLFFLMVREDLRPEDDMMVSVLSACSKLEIVKIEKWVGIFSEFIGSVDSRNLVRDPVNTILVYLYGKWGKIEKSREKFDEIAEKGKRSVLPWNSMIGAYAQNGCAMEALKLFRLMVDNPHCSPNHVTMVSVLSVCAQIGDLDLGKWIHGYMESKGCNGVVESNMFLATALIDMYSKCGSLERAKEVFDRMVSKDVVSFNAMVMGLAINGEGEEALRLFSRMQEFRLQPNASTFLSVLCACSHSGFIKEGRRLFLEMSQRFSLSPKLEHYACYIDLLSRVGLIEDAFEVVMSMPFKPNNFVWGALLGGCHLHSRVELARDISKRLVEADPESSAGYVLLSNAFAVDGRWRDVSGLRLFMRENGVRKQPGHSWISINGIVHEFIVGSQSHAQVESIYYTLDGLVKEMKAASP
ncbi:pentatricopeptide repeat-containing protein At1g08070, chloroplastic-like [Malania oleifera]|uniref:pentatricopeptide repeat-containing protein At1g08070, chloroplastic-like n=1 Tax=Malania oleifera TaxID=397392 RepID=UPI0025AE7A30|nr:pentatricopeptide repeat-containing protein At1g08070, chloroplastic-like [Malania oleifera]